MPSKVIPCRAWTNEVHAKTKPRYAKAKRWGARSYTVCQIMEADLGASQLTLSASVGSASGSSQGLLPAEYKAKPGLQTTLDFPPPISLRRGKAPPQPLQQPLKENHIRPPPAAPPPKRQEQRQPSRPPTSLLWRYLRVPWSHLRISRRRVSVWRLPLLSQFQSQPRPGHRLRRLSSLHGPSQRRRLRRYWSRFARSQRHRFTGRPQSVRWPRSRQLTGSLREP